MFVCNVHRQLLANFLVVVHVFLQDRNTDYEKHRIGHSEIAVVD